MSHERQRYRRLQLWATLICVALGIAVVIYRGPGRVFLRASLGDVIAVMFLFFALGVITRWHRFTRAGVVAAIALTIELSQLIPRTWRSPAVEIVIGSTFDPWDLVLYVVGLILAVAIDWVMVRALAKRA